MRSPKSSRIAAAMLACLASLACSASAAQSPTEPDPDALSGWELMIAPTAYHWDKDDDYSNVVALGLERAWANGSMAGLSLFRNSFGQPSAYAYYGHTWNDVFGVRNLYIKLSGGILYGYTGKYEDKVPFNHNGFSLGIVPSVGYRVTPRDAVQVGVLGTAALIFSYNRRF